jgi:predicted Zn-dependent protease
MFVLTLLMAGCSTNPVTGRPELVSMSPAEEQTAGDEAHEALLEDYATYGDKALQAYVDRVGQRLAAVSHRPELTYRFTVLDSPEINAFALPGGYVYITRGLLAYLNSEAELAGVLGHEIGHITARHAARQQTTQLATQLGIGVFSILVPQAGLAGRQAAAILGNALVLGYGRDQELEADGLGAEYLDRADYDPKAMLSVLRVLDAQQALDEKLARAEGRPVRRYHGLFSTHPDNDTRLAEVVARPASAAAAPRLLGRDPFLDAIEGLAFGEDPAGGVVEKNCLLHPALDLAVEFPKDWTVKNETRRVTATDPKGLAEIQLGVVDAKGLSDPQDVLRRLGVAEFIQATAFRIIGLPGVMGYSRLVMGGSSFTVRLIVVLNGEEALIFIGMTARERDLKLRDAEFQSVVNQLRRLTAQEHAKVHTQRIRVRTLSQDTDWTSLAADSPLRRLAVEQLRALNAGQDDSDLRAGARVKLID